MRLALLWKWHQSSFGRRVFRGQIFLVSFGFPLSISHQKVLRTPWILVLTVRGTYLQVICSWFNCFLDLNTLFCISNNWPKRCQLIILDIFHIYLCLGTFLCILHRWNRERFLSFRYTLDAMSFSALEHFANFFFFTKGYVCSWLGRNQISFLSH